MTGRPGCPGRPRFEIAEIVRRYRPELEAEQPLTLLQRKALSAIARCRTAALGGYLDTCPRCGFEHPAYNSCRNRHCPKCQALVQEKWIAARRKRLLPVRHFHVVFTLPSELRSLARYRPREIYGALLVAMSETLLELAQTHIGGCLGITMVLHTWTRDLRFHPHAHALVTAGGLELGTGRWIDSGRNYLFALEAMGKLLRGKMMAALHQLSARGKFEGFDEFRDPQGFDHCMRRLASHRWVVYAKKPFRRVEHVLRYLGRYTHRVAISNHRLVNFTEAAVTFRTKGSKIVSLPPMEFLRRFVEHVLPQGFHKIRHTGLYAGAHAHHEWAVARALLEHRSTPSHPPPPLRWNEHLRRLTGTDVTRCPRCGARLEHRPVPRSPSPSRAPPVSVAA